MFANRLEWVTKADMLVKRKDHACAMVMIGDTQGILVSGGVGEDEQLLDSVEFYSLQDETWQEMAPLKMPRTEHGEHYWDLTYGGVSCGRRPKVKRTIVSLKGRVDPEGSGKKK